MTDKLRSKEYFARPSVSNNGSRNFSTASEVAFIRELGKWAGKPKTIYEVEQLVLGYMAGCRRRQRWGGINQEVVLEAAAQKLAEVRKQIDDQAVTKR